MTTEISVSLEIPTSYDEHDYRFLVFSRWFPLGNDQRLTVDRDDLTVQLWFDQACIDGLARTDLEQGGLEELETWVNVRAYKIYVEVTLEGVSDELAVFIYEDRDRYQRAPVDTPSDDRYTRLTQESVELGRKVLETAIDIVNRFISYFRVCKGQYWLQQRRIDFGSLRSDFTKFRARVKTKDQDWFAWTPPSTDVVTVVAESEAKFLTKDEWTQVAQFIRGHSRPDLVLELLANSERLVSEGYRRSAITEAVAALEAATYRFSDSPRLEDLRETELYNRIDSPRLRVQVDRLGFSGTWRYLIPLLLSAEVLPDDLLSQCRQAIEIRGNVLHRGQRDVDEATLWSLLDAIRKTCTILARYSDS